jgi:tetratricopeptide (TPR) repeat protein
MEDLIMKFMISAIILSSVITAYAQDDRRVVDNLELIESDVFVFPKRRDISTSISRSKNEIDLLSEYPEGVYPRLTVKKIDEENYDIIYPIMGKVQKADVYQLDELLNLERKTIPRTKENDWTRFIVAEAYFCVNKFLAALDIIDSISDDSRQSTEVLILSVKCKTSLGLTESALLDIHSIEQRHPKSQMVHIMKGKALTKKREYGAAIREFVLGIGHTGSLPADAVFFQSLCNYHLGNYDLALDDLDLLILHRDSSDIEWRYLRGLVLTKKGEYDRALDDFEFVAFNPDIDQQDENDSFMVSAYINSSIIHSCRSDLKNRRPFLAIELLEVIAKYKRVDQLIREHTIAKALAFIELGRYSSAKESLEELRIMGPNNEYSWIEDDLQKLLIHEKHFVSPRPVPLLLELR